MKGRGTYRSVAVNEIDVRELAKGREGQRAIVGTDIGKFELYAVVRWPDGTFTRPVRGKNPVQVPELVRLVTQLKVGREVVVALEPSGTYGDALRQALHDAGVEVHRVSPKAAHDHAEVFDGVPSQHDGKDAAVVAELAAIGKSRPWPYQPRADWEQQLAYWVNEMECQRRITTMWLGRLEAALARHWPEATRVLKLSSGTLLRALATYGGPAALAEDEKAAARLTRWGGTFLGAEKVEALLAGARNTVGVRQGPWDSRSVRDWAERARAARQQYQHSQRCLKRLTQDQPTIQAQGKVVGVPTACVLWACLGDPRSYHCAGAYRKAMGLNLVERSSGTCKGQLKISKRGHPQTRQWLYLAALRLVQEAQVASWYQAKKAKDGEEAKRALVAVMRKVALALYHVAVHGGPFDARRLFASRRSRRKAQLAAVVESRKDTSER